MSMLMKWMYRVEVVNKLEAEKVKALAAKYGAETHKGKPCGKPGNIRCVVYVDPEPFGGRDYLRDIVAREIPDAEVVRGEVLEVAHV